MRKRKILVIKKKEEKETGEDEARQNALNFNSLKFKQKLQKCNYYFLKKNEVNNVKWIFKWSYWVRKENANMKNNGGFAEIYGSIE